jgi:chemotaxis protein methyltransferase CheR
VARTGAYPVDRLRKYDESFLQSGGHGSLGDFYTVSGRTGHFKRTLQNNVTWARHNLVTDTSFNDFHLILCANVLIYFLPTLQSRAHRLFYDSLIRSGFLAVGKRESLINCQDRDHYEQVRDGVNLFRKVRW